LFLTSIGYFLFGIVFGYAVGNAIDTTITAFRKSEEELDEARRGLEAALMQSGAIEKVLEERENK